MVRDLINVNGIQSSKGNITEFIIKMTVILDKKGKGTILYSAVSSAWDWSKRLPFTPSANSTRTAKVYVVKYIETTNVPYKLSLALIHMEGGLE